jgi:hypothetical protein
MSHRESETNQCFNLMHSFINRVFTAVFLFIMLQASGATVGEPLIVQAVLKDSPAIQWEGKKQQALDELRIKEDASIRLESCSDITITACELHSIELINCDRITIRNCWLHDSARVGVVIGSCRQVLIEGCRMENVVSGMYACGSQGIQVIGNFVRNVQGPLPRGEVAQFDEVSGANNAIRDNYAINERGKSHPEDCISLFKSTGTAESPIVVENNYLTGDPVDGSQDKSAIGSGIMLGDYGGAHILCRRNVIICAGQCGLGVAGGQFISVEDNVIFGKKSNVSNVGLYVWNQSKLPGDHVTVVRNRVSWVNKDGEENSWWNGGGVEQLVESENHFSEATLPDALPDPPSHAPMPPKPWSSIRADGTSVVTLPWKP